MSLNSDEEFWNDVEIFPVLKSNTKFKLTDFFEIVPQGSLSISSTKYEKVFSNMRLAKEIEINTRERQVRKQTIKEVQHNVEDIKNKYELEVSEIVIQNHQLKNECMSLRKRLKRAVETCKIQEYLLTCCRIVENIEPEVIEVEKTDKDEFKALKTQIKLLRNVCNLYMSDIDQAKIKVAGLEQDILRLQEDHCKEIEKLEEKCVKVEKDLKKMIEKEQQKFEDFKKDVKEEIDLNSVINKKLTDTITRLKDELKNAQNILQTPRLRQKTMARFKSLAMDKIAHDKSIDHVSLLSLPSITTEKEGFSTHFHTPKGSRLIDFPGFNKK